MLLEHLKETYGLGKPIFISEIKYNGLSPGAIRHQVKRLMDSGALKRYSTGVYFIPKPSLLPSGASLSLAEVVEKKYIVDGGERLGYYSGIMLANMLGLTTQVPYKSEIVSNKASRSREVPIKAGRIILRKPRVEVTDDNYRYLALLDILSNLDLYAEVGEADSRAILISYIRKAQLDMDRLWEYARYYPDKVYRFAYEYGLLVPPKALRLASAPLESSHTDESDEGPGTAPAASFLEHLKATYGVGKPIFISRIEYNCLSRGAIRHQVMRLCKAGKLVRYDRGIYFFPKETDYAFVPTLSRSTVIAKKYLFDGGRRCGYYTGFILANQLGLTTQVPATRTVVTNKATRGYRVVRLGNVNVILRKPRVRVDETNYQALSVLDLVKDIESYAEWSEEETGRILAGFIQRHGLSFHDLEKHLHLYPERIYRNLASIGLLVPIKI